MAAILEKFEEETDTEVYITPGNHDLNNSNAMNFNTEDGVAAPAGRTTQEDYKKNLWISAGSKHTCLSIHIPPVQIAIFHSQNKHFRGCEIGRDRDVMHIA